MHSFDFLTVHDSWTQWRFTLLALLIGLVALMAVVGFVVPKCSGGYTYKEMCLGFPQVDSPIGAKSIPAYTV